MEETTRHKDSLTEDLHFHLVRAELHASQALTLLYQEYGIRRSVWFRKSLRLAQWVLRRLFVKEADRRRKKFKESPMIRGL